MSGIFGGSKSSSNSYNQFAQPVAAGMAPVVGAAGSGINSLQALLGGDASGFNAYKNATGFDAMAEAGSRGITNNMAAKGLLRSGAAGTALERFGVGLQNQYADSYMNKLLSMIGLGVQGAGVTAQAGQVSNSKSSSKPGLGGFLGGALSAV